MSSADRPLIGLTAESGFRLFDCSAECPDSENRYDSWSIAFCFLQERFPTGSKLFFDLILLEAYEKPHEYGFASTKVRSDAFGEVMSFGFRRGTAHVKAWLEAQGLEFVRSYTHLNMVALYEQQTGRPAPSRGTPWSNLCIAAF